MTLRKMKSTRLFTMQKRKRIRNRLRSLTKISKSLKTKSKSSTRISETNRTNVFSTTVPQSLGLTLLSF